MSDKPWRDVVSIRPSMFRPRWVELTFVCGHQARVWLAIEDLRRGPQVVWCEACRNEGSGEPEAADAVDPSVANSGTPPTREKASS